MKPPPEGGTLNFMTYIVAEPCIECKYTDCAAVCPVEAIFSDMSIPEEYLSWLEVNKEAENYPIISTKQPALFGPSCKGQPE